MPAINYISSSRYSQVRRESGQRVVTEISLESVPDPTPQGAMVTGGSEESSADPVMEDFVTRMAELGYVDGEDYTSETLFQYNSLETLYPEYVSDYEESTANLSIVIGECCYSDLRFWYHPDYLGSIAMVTNDDGELHQYFFYNAWGENMYTFEPNNSFNSPYRFNGKELDQETGLAYYGARYYDNQLSMWLSVDPLAHEYRSFSPYCFTVNNPVMLLDPDGRWVPGVDDDGNVTYTAEQGDNLSTLMEQYGLTYEQASSITENCEMSEGSVIAGEKVEEVTGSEVLKLQVPTATGDDLNHQLAFAFTLADSKDESEFNMNDFYSQLSTSFMNGEGGTFDGIGTSTSPPVTTEVNFMGKKETISFDYANKSDGRVSTNLARQRNPWVDYKYFEDYNHPDSGNGAIPQSPSLTITFYWKNWRKYAK